MCSSKVSTAGEAADGTAADAKAKANGTADAKAKANGTADAKAKANGTADADAKASIPSFAAAHQGAPSELPAPASLGPAPAPIALDAGTPDSWVPRDERLIRLTGRHPLNCEPHLSDLLAAGFITPVSLHFVRNHGATPQRDWATHTVTVDGLVPAPLTLSMDALVALRPRRELAVTFCCAGNRRKEQNLLRQSRGFNWGAGAVSTSVWTGVRLADLLAEAGVARGDPANVGRHVRFTGPPGELPNGDGTYGTSIPLAKALDPAADVLIAYKQNGRWLAPDHGFPVRVILPGHIGGRTIKWLTRIEVADAESDNWYHFYDNRVFPPHILTPEQAEDAGAWRDPDYMINHYNINSAICEPSHDAVVPLSAGGATAVTFRGYAYAGGGRKVTRVELSLDGGESTWKPATIHRMEPPTEHGMTWTWCFFSCDFTVAELAAAPAGDVQVRAADETMNTQPGRDAVVWSLLGMQGNAHFAVRAVVEMLAREATAHGTGEALAPGTMVLRFQHPAPIHPGPLGNVGWREEEAARREAAGGAAAAAPPPPTPAAAPAGARKITAAELAAHAGDDEAAWFSYRGKVYDATAFLEGHPGGADSILISTGTDATDDFDAIHSAKAKAMLEGYYIGDLVGDEEEEGGQQGAVNGTAARPAPAAPATPPAGPPAALDPRTRRAFPLVSKAVLSPNTRLFKFGLPPGHVLGLPVGKHVFLYGTPPTGGEVMRAYTPVSTPDATTLDLLIKVYDDSLGGGVMSRWLDSLAIGATVQVKGPVGHFEYMGPGACTLHRKPVTGVTRLTFVAAGTGITPAYAVLRAVFGEDPAAADGAAATAVLIYANRYEEDVLLAGELDALAARSGGRLAIVYTLSRPGPGWRHARGRIDGAMLRKHALAPGEGAMAFACGPPALVEDVVKPGLAAAGYPAERVVVF